MTLLEQAYHPENFRQQAHALTDLLADYLVSVQTQAEPTVIPFVQPDKALAFWKNHWEQHDSHDLMSLFQEIIQRSTHLHHPRYMGHQVDVVPPLAALTSMLTALLNNGMAVYEMGLVSNPLEHIVTDHLCTYIGFGKEAGGVLTSGGTLANLTALLAARARYTAVWDEGHSQRLAVMVSEEAHYCVDRAARVMGLGDEGIIKVPVNEALQMRTDLLEACYQAATQRGIRVVAIVGSACTTSSGSYDDLRAIGAFAQANDLWFHVDGAHGAAVVFSEKHKSLVAGIDLADSVVVDWHKMLMAPALATSLVFRQGDEAYHTFHQKAQYLWADAQSEDWFNSGKRTFECTKYMMSVKIYVLLKTYGVALLTENVERLYDLGQQMAQAVTRRPSLELALWPQTNIVCFRVSHPTAPNPLNTYIRQALLEAGNFYIVQTTLQGQLYLRVSIMNPLTQPTDLEALLDEVENLAAAYSA
jgi:L-2,4-diaminobutyrate decarboxylase